MKTKILLIATAVVAAGIIALAIAVHSPEPNCMNPGFASYISAYTESPASKLATIKVVLNSSLADSTDLSKLDPEDLLEIYPSVSGTARFADERTLEFTPEQPLKSGFKYIAEFKLKKVAKVKGDLARFIFPVTTIAQDMSINIEDQVTTDRKTLAFQQISGSVKTADVEASEYIQKTVTATDGSKEYKIKWKNAEAGNVFNFTIDSIERGQEARELAIKYNGKPIGSKTQGEKKVQIPAVSEFKVCSVKVMSAPSQYIKIQFTDPVKESQDLSGLITVVSDDNSRSDDQYTIETADNCVNIYPKSHEDGSAKLYVAAGIQNILGTKLDGDKVFSIYYEMQKPQIRSVKSGLILPDGNDGLVYPFEAINLTAVDVTVVKVLEKNILSYIRDYSESWNSENLQQTGVPVFRQTIHINDRNSDDVSEWKRYYLELSKLIKAEPGSIYNIKIAFRKSHAIFDCDTCNGGDDASMEKDISITDFDSWNGYYEQMDYDYYSSCGYDWKKEDNPCYKMYYQNQRFLSQNILASNLGIIAKKGGNEEVEVFVTDLKTASPVQDATVELYGYQQQMIASKTTDKDGKAAFGPQPKGYFVVAKLQDECNYLKIKDGNSLSMSKFDISGSEVQNGLKGYIYGERGVWRPGDSLHLSFILNEDPGNPLPDDYPITMEVAGPQQQQIFKETATKNKSNFYVFAFKTQPEAPAGSYEATVSCGNARFSKWLRIENVLPNRLKINTAFSKETFGPGANTVSIQSKWLHGAPARGLKASVEMMLCEQPLTFAQWQGYTFSNARNSSAPSQAYEEVFSGNLSEGGAASFQQKFDAAQGRYPNKMTAKFRIRVFENGGRFSKDEASVDVLPYKSYVGIKLPETESRFLRVDEPQIVQVAICDNAGKEITESRNVRMRLYKMEWQWWYDASNYVSDYNSTLVSEENITVSGTGNYKFIVKYPQWGRFLIEATDTKTGATSSQFFYMDWPDSFGRSPIMSQGSTIVEMSADKEKYTVGDVANITIPSPGKGHALITIENGTKVLSSQWITTGNGKTEYKLKIEKDFEPGVYVSASILQPHSQTANDMPIRMYGVLPLNIENPETKLEPAISMPDILEADKDVKITVSEKNNKKMTYTIALVDDGLLDLTHYKTPDPWKQFYSREALGVKTIDMFDNVIGAFGGTIEKMFSIGGDGESSPASAAKANNFESVAAFLGPFTTNGGKHTHTIKMPKYIGSVRAMVVAGNGKAYGSAEKTCTVTKPLMVFATTPRIVGAGDKFKLPVTVFAGDSNIGSAIIKITASDGLCVMGDNTRKLQFDGAGQQDPSFEIQAGNASGIGKIHISAISGSHASEIDLALEVRQPNTSATQMAARTVKPGETAEISIRPAGREGTNEISATINGMLPIKYDSHVASLMSYPYESLETTVCKAFPMVYAASVTNMKGQEKEMAENLIRESIKKIYGYQTEFGGLSYWRGDHYTNVWATSLAGHFMLEAKKAGYGINPDFLLKWKKFQRLKADSWTPDTKQSYAEQAYRLYTLALAGEPSTGQMNRLKEQPEITGEAKAYLAAAYAISGKKQVAEGILSPITASFESSPQIKLIALCDLELQEKAFLAAKAISESLTSDYCCMSCQNECMSLVAIGKYFEKYKPASEIHYEYSWNGEPAKTASSSKTFATEKLQVKEGETQKMTFTNHSEGTLYVEITSKGIPEPGSEKAENSAISASIAFFQGSREISPRLLKQGDDFTAVIKVRNLSDQYLGNLAITEMFPSGWEIMTGLPDEEAGSGSYYYRSGTIKHTDTRDDRKFTYFTLPASGEMVFRTRLTATYAGTYYLPGLSCSDLENPKVFARTKGMTVTVEEDN